MLAIINVILWGILGILVLCSDENPSKTLFGVMWGTLMIHIIFLAIISNNLLN